MHSPTGLSSHFTVGLLTLLSAGAIVLSLETAPPVAKQQLQSAAHNTIAASSFVLTDVNTISSSTPIAALGGKKSESNVVRIRYEAPDRIIDEITEPNGQNVTLLVVGDSRFERFDHRQWTQLPSVPRTGITTGAAFVRELLVPLQSFAGATSVVHRGSNYFLIPGNESSLLQSLFGAQAASRLTSVTFSATVNGEFVGSERVSAKRAGVDYTVAFFFSSVDSKLDIATPRA